MVWNPAAQHMAKLDEWGKDATDRFKAASNNASGSAGGAKLGDRLKAARSGAGMTAIGQRWEAEKAARAGTSATDDASGTATPPPPPAVPQRKTAPAAEPFPARPPPPPQRNSGSNVAAGRPPPPPARPALPARPSASSATATTTTAERRGPPPPPPSRSSRGPPPTLPPRMNNEAGVAHPPPPYSEDLNEAVRGMSVGDSTSRGVPPAPPARANKPPIPARPASTTTTPPTAAVLPPLSASRHPADGPCKALEAATFFCYPTHYPEWTSNPPWFYDPSSPRTLTQPPVVAQDANRRDYAWQGSFSTYGSDCTQLGVLQFDDLSTLWYKISFNTTNPTSFDCKAAYVDVPQPWTEATHPGLLLASSQGYGELVARQVESWSGTVVGDGECWTLAHEALRAVNASQGYTQDLKLFESVGRTHGHLIYRCVPGGGAWRGGDQGHIRRGDVLEWEHSQCKLADGRTTATMGNPAAGMPDHTAVVVDVDIDESRPVTDPARFRSITVLEQSAGQAVHRTSLAVGQLISGGFWVFRPVGSVALLEGKVEPKWQDSQGRSGWEALN